MNSPVKIQPQLKPKPDVGESHVWLSAMGLSIGLVMVATLLSVILWNGIEVFWPKRIVELTVNENGKEVHIGGEIIQRRNKPIQSDGKIHAEIQIFTGNKEVYGQGFRFVDVDDVVKETMPSRVMRVERMTYGNAIGKPVRLKIGGGEPIPADDARFDARLHEAITEVAARRDEILHIEEQLIGSISRQIAAKEIDIKTATRRNELAVVSAAKEEIATLSQQSTALAVKSRDLRKRKNENSLEMVLFSGEKKSVAMGNVVDVTFSNELSWFGRAGAFVTNLWHFMVEKPREANTEGGIWPAIFGTFVMTLLMSVAVTPVGVVAAIYLREYAKQGPLVRMVRIAVNNLAGVPSIVFGVFGLGFFVYIVGGNIDSLFFSDKLPTPTFGTGGIMWAALTMALMTVPVVIVATEESIAAVPRGAREGSLACGASKWQTIQRVVLPASIPGILTGLILAMARGAGEVAPLMLVGVVKLAPTLPLDSIYPFFHLDQKFMHLGFHIYDLGFQSPDSEAAKPMVFATTFFLIMLVMVLNLGAIILRERIRRRFATSAF
jgi:phosphate transport system permease protein